MITIVVTLIGTICVSFAITAVVRRYALRRGVLDHPNQRSSHLAATPRGGGVAIVVTSAVAVLLLAVAHAIASRTAIVVAGGMIIIAGIGWLDDHASVAPRVRLAVHLLTAFAAVGVAGGLPDLRIGVGSIHLGIAGAFIAALAIVWSINLFNFMDGIDGIAGSEAVLVFGAIAIVLAMRADTSLAYVAAVIACATIGFVLWNWPPARIFLGDVGSGALGYGIGATALLAERHGSMPLLAVTIIYGVFVTDATVTLLRRLARGDRAAEAHRDHAYQRLSRAWGGHRPVTVASASTTIALVALGILGTERPSLLPLALALAALLLGSLFYLVERRAPLSRTRAQVGGRAS